MQARSSCVVSKRTCLAFALFLGLKTIEASQSWHLCFCSNKIFPQRGERKLERHIVVSPSNPPTVMSGRPNDDNDTKSPLMTPSPSRTTKAIRSVLDMLRDSEFIREKHTQHVESDGVTHLFKGTPFAAASNELKLRFVNSWAGNSLSAVVREEGIYLRTWKIDKIREAAGDFDDSTVRAIWGPEVLSDTDEDGSDVVVYSFEDCPWCVAAVDLLQSIPSYQSGKTKMRVVELEKLGLVGKQVRAILAEETGRTSMPCIFIKGKPIGGFTDGEPCGIGLKPLYERGELDQLLT